jgi:hypothetical protein
MADTPATPPTSSEPPNRPPTAVIRALDIFAALLVVLGTGEHAITCVVSHPRGLRVARVHLQIYEPGQWRSIDPPRKLSDLIEVLAVTLDERHGAAIITRSRYATGDNDDVRAWALDGTWPQPLTAAEVRAAYTTHPITGQPLPAEPDVSYGPGTPLPRPDQPHT